MPLLGNLRETRRFGEVTLKQVGEERLVVFQLQNDVKLTQKQLPCHNIQTELCQNIVIINGLQDDEYIFPQNALFVGF